MKKRGVILILILLSFSISFVSASQNFLNKTVSYEYGKFKPELRNVGELTNYFKKLDLQENFTYFLLGFNDSAPEKQIISLEMDGAEQIGVYGDDVYLYKFPTEILETKTYDFIGWIDVPKSKDKMNQELKDSLNLNNTFYVKVEF